MADKFVVPAEAGTQALERLDSRSRGNDNKTDKPEFFKQPYSLRW